MDSQNIKIYLAISGALIVLLILIIVIPFTKQKPVTSPQQPVTNLIPTTVQTGSTDSTDSTNSTGLTVPASFTGAIDEPISQNIIDLAAQKKDLQSKVPLSLSTFSIDFDYSQDKFVVTLKDPKDTAQKEFESWRTGNYPGLGSEQFLIR
ncbi:MAG: hypothetical protein AAB705_01110 [Patescibacteria group bacterium]